MKRPFLIVAGAFAAGIACGSFVTIPLAVSLTAGAVSALAILAFSKYKALSHSALFLALFFCGAASYQQSVILPRDHIIYATADKPEKAFLRGIVVDDPAIDTAFYGKEKKSFTLAVSAYKKLGDWQACRGLVKVDQYFKKARPLWYGDEVTAEGFLYQPSGLKNPGLFDYAKYLATRGIYSIFKVRENYVLAVTGRYQGNPVVAFAYKARSALRSSADRYLEYPYSGFVNAIMIGDRSSLPDAVTDDFVRTGTVHILAISGLNLGIIAAIILAVFGICRVPRRVNLALTLLAVGIYTITAGSSPPVVRAAVVFAVYVIGALIRRDADMLNSLGIAAFAILAWNPRELFDPSFQLSFISVASIVVLTPVVERCLGFNRIKGHTAPAKIAHYVAKGIAVSAAAWLGTWPIVAFYFNIVSPVSLIANLVIVPALSVLTVVSSSFLSAAVFSHAAASALAAATQAITQATFSVNRLFAAVPCAYFRIGAPSAAQFVGYYALLAAALLPPPCEGKRIIVAGRLAIRRGMVFAAILAALNLAVWQEGLSRGRAGLTVTFLDVGQGDCAVIRAPSSGGVILVDGGVGGSEEKFDVGKNVVAPYLWNQGLRRLDAIIVTHFHDDHLGGILYILDHFDVGMVFDTNARSVGSPLYGAYLEKLRQKQVRRVALGEGDVLKIGDAALYILNPAKGADALDSNDDSIVGKLVSKNVSVLLCGDVQEKGIGRLEAYGEFLRSEIAKVPHHGSSLGEEGAVAHFFDMIAPRAVVISVARINSYNAPSRAVINALTSLNIMTYETKDSGACVITECDGSVSIMPVAGEKLTFL